jgi:hypothetical protein
VAVPLRSSSFLYKVSICHGMPIFWLYLMMTWHRNIKVDSNIAWIRAQTARCFYIHLFPYIAGLFYSFPSLWKYVVNIYAALTFIVSVPKRKRVFWNREVCLPFLLNYTSQTCMINVLLYFSKSKCWQIPEPC